MKYLILLVFAVVSCKPQIDPNKVNQLEAVAATQALQIERLAQETELFKWQIDSLKRENKAIIGVLVKLDSAYYARSEKSIRRENTGRFVGGLVRGLFGR
jgi:hypothetical protein